MISNVNFLSLLLVCVPFVSSDSVSWCVCPSTLHVLQNSTCLSLGDAIRSPMVSWQAMRGEIENKQILVDTRGWDPTANLTASVSLTFSDLLGAVGQIDSGNLSWWQVGYVYCNATRNYADSGGGWRPDPLLAPLENRIFLEVGVTQPLWIQISVPQNALSGSFLGSITMTIEAPKSGSTTVVVPIHLTVWDITVPELKNAKFPAVFSFAPDLLREVYGSNSSTVVWDFINLFIEQRIAGNHLYAGTPEYPQYSQYYAQHGVQWLTMLSVGSKCNASDSDIQSLLERIQEGVNQFQHLGILDNMFLYGFDETNPSCVAALQKVWSAVKAHWPHLRTMSTLNWAPPTDLPMDAWVKSYHIYNKTEADKWIETGHQQWWYHCLVPEPTKYMNTFIERPLMETRLLFWLAGQHNVSGWLYYNVANFEHNKAIVRLNGTARTNYDPAVYPDGGTSFWNGDGNFVYPGPNGPVPSTRLHNLRDGFEDAELFRMLPLDSCAPLLSALVRSPTDFTLDPLLMEQQRIKVAELVEHKTQKHTLAVQN